MRNKIEAVNSAQTNFKMYKKGKQWLFASAVALVALGATSVASTAHADTTTSDQPQVATTQASGNGNQETITTYPHKDQIDQAVQSVQNTPHLSVTQDPDQTITGSSQAEIDQKIQDDYNQQQQYLKQRQDEAKRSAMQQSNYQTYNETHGDTRQLDQDVKDAQNIPGLTVVKDSDTDSSFDAEDTTGLKNWATNTQKNYQSQGDEIHKAIDTQKRNNQEYDQQEADYQHNLTEWRNSHRKIPNPDGVAASDIKQSLTLNREPDAVVSAPGLIPYTIGYTGDNNGNSALSVDSKTGISFSKDTTVTFTNLKNSFYYDQQGNKINISKITAKFYDIQANPNKGSVDIDVYSDPTDGFWYRGVDRVKVDYQFFDSNGNVINFDPNTAYLGFGSLNSGYYGDHGRTEGVNILNGEAVALLGSGITKHGNYLYADDSLRGKLDYVHVNDDGSYSVGDFNDQNWDHQNQYRYFGTGLDNLSGKIVSVEYVTTRDLGGTDTTDTWATMSTVIPSTPGPQKPVRKTSEAHYRYNTSQACLLTPL